jgi:CRP-like cAMP-binding protein
MLKPNEANNYLLALLKDKQGFFRSSALNPVTLERGQRLYHPNTTPKHCLFIETGLASVIVTSPEGHKAEAGVVGREGMVPVSAFTTDGGTPMEVTMQVGGSGFKIEFAHFREAFEGSAEVREIFLRYAHAFLVQSAFTALSNANHRVEERLARWLLICHDRVDGDELPLTHEFLAIMLAVRRPSVTIALHVLEGHRFIRAERNLITVRDRAGLELFANDAYGPSEREYERLLKPLSKTAIRAA